MRLVTFQRSASSEPEVGMLAGEEIVSLAGAGYSDMLSLIEAGSTGLEKIRTYAQSAPADARTPLNGAKLLAPIPRPRKLICVGLNYRDHAIESNMEIPKVPTIFNKFATSVIGPGDTVVLPKASEKPDYEAEMAVVIGPGGRHIGKEDWQAHVFGYTIVNDVSARDFQMATTQWLMGKTFDTFAPIGPWIVTADEVPDPHALDVKMTINGEVLQHSNTKELIFRVPDLIAYLSSVFTLEPGDIVSTGTPAGVGFARKPPRYLREGDDMVVSVSGVGELRNPVTVQK